MRKSKSHFQRGQVDCPELAKKMLEEGGGGLAYCMYTTEGGRIGKYVPGAGTEKGADRKR